MGGIAFRGEGTSIAGMLNNSAAHLRQAVTGKGPLRDMLITLENGKTYSLANLGALIQAERPLWTNYLNNSFGVAAFASAIQIAEMQTHLYAGLVSFLFLAVGALQVARMGTPTTYALRNTPGPRADAVNRAVTQSHFRLFASPLKEPLYWIGSISLLASTVGCAHALPHLPLLCR
jgi:hypothetical protein